MRASAAILVSVFSLGVFACHDKRPAEGPMEYSGRKVDEGAHATKEGVEKAGHETKCAAKNAKDDAKKQYRDPACN